MQSLNTQRYLPVLHRIFYIPTPNNSTLWLALCLYNPMIWDMSAKCVVVHATDGTISELNKQHHTGLLSKREKEVLYFINKGLTSKEIAQRLSISIHTVSRHRQEILNKLKVKNSIEACRVGNYLNLL